jgi:hypothetical protein
MKNPRLDGKIQVYRRLGQESSVNSLQAGAALAEACIEPFSRIAQPALGRPASNPPMV